MAAFDEVTHSPQIRTTVAPCQIHKTRHIPTPHVNHRHHIWPLGEGGPDIEDNIVVVCPTGHYNTHLLYNEFKLYEGEPPYKVLRRYSDGEREYAELGYKRFKRKAI